MLCYLAMLWDRAGLVGARSADALLIRLTTDAGGWSVAIEVPGLVVCLQTNHASPLDKVYPLARNQGVVLGKLFRKHNVDVPVLDDAQSAAIVATSARALVTDYWGQYIAFVRDGTSGVRWVLRDPTGGIPCQCAEIDRVAVYFARLKDFELLGMRPFTIDHDFLASYLLYNNIFVRRTGLKEVSNVLAGECVEHAAIVRRHWYWNPVSFVSDASLVSRDEAIRDLRETVCASVAAWASCFDSIVLRLSGGLDSSIILSCLAERPASPPVVCLHDYGDEDSRSDERYFARRMAAHARTKLVERQWTGGLNLHVLDHIGHTATPYAACSGIDSPLDDELPSSHGETALFEGHGGDELFFRYPCVPPTTDFLWANGLSASVFGMALDDAGLVGTSIWRVLRNGIRFGLLRRPWHIRRTMPVDHNVLIADRIRSALAEDEQCWPELFRGRLRVPPAKIGHAFYLTMNAATRSYNLELPHGYPEPVWPLFTQPIMELVLRIPTYLLCSEGRDRSLVRDAFRDSLPSEILFRKSKGTGTNNVRNTLWENVAFVRAFLLDGFLVRNGYLERRAIEQVLAGFEPTYGGIKRSEG